jgi:lantibiotic biosynthesis protein
MLHRTAEGGVLHRAAESGVDSSLRRTPWHPVLEAHERSQALAVVREVAARLRDPSRIDRAVASARQLTRYPRSIDWRPNSLSQGYAGLAVLWSTADACMPDEGWDIVGHEHLQLAVQALQRLPRLGYGASSGIAGVAFAARLLSRGGKRYRRLLATLESALKSQMSWVATALAQSPPHGVNPSTFDAISGLSGAARYLLIRREEEPLKECLEVVLRCLVALSGETDGLPRWHTPAHCIADDATRQLFPYGNLNCGLAHGIPGPLALLGLATRCGIVVEGQLEAMRRMADWLLRQRIDDAWGMNWPTAVPLSGPPERAGQRDPAAPDPAQAQASRTAWCYGSPGIARALWHAGVALSDDEYTRIATSAMEAVYRRPPQARQIDSPTFCHGVAGLQQITLRFAHESGTPLFVDAARALHRQLVEAYEPDSLLGYRSIEPGGTRIDQPGLLDGAAGVALVLLAAATAVEPAWDALFLLS